jgi:hypothetical protein
MYEDEKTREELKRLQSVPDNELTEDEFKFKHGLLTELEIKGGIPPAHC